MTEAPPDRIRLTYHLACPTREDAARKARDIAVEQTVELPEGSFPARIEERIVGRVETLQDLGGSRWEAVVSYDPSSVGDDLPQLINLLYGNISMKGGIRLTDFQLPAAVLSRLPGPQFGVEGTRRLCGCEERRALLCAVAKPMGLSLDALAEICFRFARAGMDIVKDDHGLANQATAPFEERVRRCQDAVAKANAESGGRTLYFPNLTGPVDALERRLELLRSVSCRGAMVSPLLLGLDTVRWIAERGGIAILSHPTFTGTFFLEPEHGIAPDLLFGWLFRMIGSDGVIYPHAGGRFPFFTPELCEAINRRLRGPLGSLRPAFPVPGGGVDAARVPHWIDRYGVDTIFVVGGSLYRQPDFEEAARHLVQAVRRHGDERPPTEPPPTPS